MYNFFYVRFVLFLLKINSQQFSPFVEIHIATKLLILVINSIIRIFICSKILTLSIYNIILSENTSHNALNYIFRSYKQVGDFEKYSYSAASVLLLCVS